MSCPPCCVPIHHDEHSIRMGREEILLPSKLAMN